MSATTLEAGAKYEIVLTTGEVLNFRRMSEREYRDFLEKDLPWLTEQSSRLLTELDRDSYERFLKVLRKSLQPIMVDEETPKILAKFDNAMLYRMDAFTLLPSVLEREDGGSGLPTAGQVDGMSNEEAEGLGEDSPPSSRARSTTGSGSPAAMPSNGAAKSSDTKSKTSKTSRAR